MHAVPSIETLALTKILDAFKFTKPGRRAGLIASLWGTMFDVEIGGKYNSLRGYSRYSAIAADVRARAIDTLKDAVAREFDTNTRCSMQELSKIARNFETQIAEVAAHKATAEKQLDGERPSNIIYDMAGREILREYRCPECKGKGWKKKAFSACTFCFGKAHVASIRFVQWHTAELTKNIHLFKTPMADAAD